jgi:hypothetical protein
MKKILVMVFVSVLVARAQHYSYFDMKYAAGFKLNVGSSYPFWPHGAFLPNGGMYSMFSGDFTVITTSKIMIFAEAGYFVNSYDILEKQASRFSGSAFSLSLRRFFSRKKNAVAPVGKFFDFEIREINSAIKFIKDGSVQYNHPLSYYADDVKNRAVILSIGFGNSIIVKNRLLLTSGIKMAPWPPFILSESGPAAGAHPKVRIWRCNTATAYYSVSYLF